MAWLILIVSGLFETVWSTSMKYSDGFTRLWPSIITLIAMAISVFGLAYAMRTIPLGTAYVIWTGIGAIGAFVMGIMFFNDPLTLARIFFAALIVAGLIGLKVTAGI